MIAGTFVLCMTTALACAALLLRSYASSRVPLLLWSGLFFLGLAINNALVYVDVVVTPDTLDLDVVRKLPALAGAWLLLFAVLREDP